MRFPIDKIGCTDDVMSMSVVSFFSKRPAGVIVLGGLCVLFGLGNLMSPIERPILAGGVLYTGRGAVILHIGSSLLVLWLGYGLLKPLRYILQLYLISAWAGITSLTLNLLHDGKLWEFSLFLGLSSGAVPVFVSFSRESHALLMASYALTSLYVYSQRSYFWGDENT